MAYKGEANSYANSIETVVDVGDSGKSFHVVDNALNRSGACEVACDFASVL